MSVAHNIGNDEMEVMKSKALGHVKGVFVRAQGNKMIHGAPPKPTMNTPKSENAKNSPRNHRIVAAVGDGLEMAKGMKNTKKKKIEEVEPVVGLVTLGKITAQSNQVLRKTEKQRRKIESLQKAIEDLTRSIESKRKSLHKETERLLQATKEKSKGTNYDVRLSVAQVKLSQGMEKDRELRVRINDLRKEQIRSVEVYQELMNEHQQLLRRKDLIDGEIKQTRQEEADLKKRSRLLREAVSSRIRTFKEEWKNMGTLVDAKSEKERERVWAAKKEKEVTEEHDRQNRETEAGRALAMHSPFGLNTIRGVGSISNITTDVALAGQLNVEEETKLKSTIQKGRWQIVRGKVALHTLASKVENYEEGFKLIMEKTGITDIEEMVDQFIAREDENFRLFSHVNTLSEQIEELEKTIESERSELERFRGKEDDAGKGQTILQSLETKLESADDQMTREMLRIEEYTKTIDATSEAVLSLFNTIGCNAAVIEPSSMMLEPCPPEQDSQREVDHPCDTDGKQKQAQVAPSPISRTHKISSHNLMQYLGLIEERVSELLMIYAITNKRKSDDFSTALKRFHGNKNTIGPTAVVAPVLPSLRDNDKDQNWDDGGDDEEDDGIRPFSHDELLQKVSRAAKLKVEDNLKRRQSIQIANAKAIGTIVQSGNNHQSYYLLSEENRQQDIISPSL